MLGSTQILPLEAPPVNWNLRPLPPSQLTNQEIIEEKVLQSEQNYSNQSVATHTGIIHPPPDIRSIVDKTALYVSQNGSQFESKVKAEKAKNAQFGFLISSDPYHAFYQHKLAEYRARNQDTCTEDPKPEECDAQCDLQAQFKVPPKSLEPPEFDYKFLEGVTSEELDIIKLTSLFVARDGQSFLTGFQSRESNNPQFHFMKPTHSMFPLFTALVDAYFHVLKPPRDLKEKLRKSCADFTAVLERCLHRLEWDRFQEKERTKDEDEREKERVEMAMIDWHDFAVVDSIDFAKDKDEELHLPIALEEVIKRSKVSAIEQAEIAEPGMEVKMELEMDGEENNLVGEENVNDEEAPMRVVKNWKRPEDRMVPTERNMNVVVSPITGELIPINEMSEHMRISLIDPKFKEHKDQMFAKIRETILAQDDEIAENIVGLARLRPDIFGTTEEEVLNAVKAEMEKTKDEQPKQVIWDGHTGSIGRTASQALNQNSIGEEQGNGFYGDPISFPGPAALPRPPNLALNLPPPPPSVMYPVAPRPLGVPMMQDQVLMPCPRANPSMIMNHPPQMQPGMLVPHPSHFAHLQVPRPYGQLPLPSMGMMQPPPMPGISAPPPLPEEPEPKRQKLDELVLVPEDQFLAQHPGSATIRVSVPNMDDGQVIEITVQSLSENVGSLKEKIAGEMQTPANKQKLSGRAGFLKDNMSLAHYNVGPGENLTLSLRERGGRKR